LRLLAASWRLWIGIAALGSGDLNNNLPGGCEMSRLVLLLTLSLLLTGFA